MCVRVWDFFNFFSYELCLVQLHFFILAIISWVISLLLITSHTTHSSNMYRNCNWGSGLTGLTCRCVLYLAESKGHFGWDPACKLFCPPLNDTWSVWNDCSKIHLLGLFYFPPFYLWWFGGLVFCRDTLCGRKSINKVYRKHFMDWSVAVKGKAMHLKCNPASPPLRQSGCSQHHHWLKSLSLLGNLLIYLDLWVPVFCF